MRNICLLLILISVLMAACVTKTANMAGKVNGTAIPNNEYMAEFRNRWDAFSIQNNRPPNSDEKSLLVTQTWQNITKDVILRQHFKKYSITATMQEAIDSLKARPPAYILTSPLFMVDGRFDSASYYQSLDYDRPENLTMLKRQYQAYYVPIAKLKNMLIEKEMLSASDKALINKIVTGTADIDWVVIDSNELDAVVTDSEVQEYYQANQTRWILEPRFSLGYVSLPVNPSGVDNQFAKALIDSLASNSSDPKNMEGFLTKHPSIHTKDSGYVFLMDLDPQIKMMLSSLSEGQFSSPYSSSGEWRVIQMVQMTKSMVIYITYSVPVQASLGTAAAMLAKANMLKDMVRQLGYKQAAGEMDLSHQEHIDLTPDTKWIDDTAIMSQVNDMLSTVQGGYVFEPIYYPARSAWIVIQLTDNQNKRYRSISDMKPEIVAELRVVRQNEIAMRNAMDWLKDTPRSITDSKSLPGSRIVSSKNVGIGSAIESIPIKDIYFDAMNRHFTKQSIQAYSAGSLVLIPFVQSFAPSNQTSVSRETLRYFYAFSLGKDWFNNWMNTQVKNASVRIYTTP